jgi:hypothetical protein
VEDQAADDRWRRWATTCASRALVFCVRYPPLICSPIATRRKQRGPFDTAAVRFRHQRCISLPLMCLCDLSPARPSFLQYSTSLYMHTACETSAYAKERGMCPSWFWCYKDAMPLDLPFTVLYSQPWPTMRFSVGIPPSRVGALGAGVTGHRAVRTVPIGLRARTKLK